MKKPDKSLAKLTGKRLRTARSAAKIPLAEAAQVLFGGDDELLRMIESGGVGVPDVHCLIDAANLYAVSVDYLIGRLDDPSACPVETNQGAIARAVVASVRRAVDEFQLAVANTAIDQLRETSAERIAKRIDDLQAAYGRVKVLNQDFEDDIKGSARLEASIAALAKVAKGLREVASASEHGASIRANC